ncbi:MAG: amino acid dehydrogenase [Acidimicrobiia bacterium]|nr:amino acid dehydrogenase [Acidimicrobiia bacterium]
MFTHPEFSDHESVTHVSEPVTGLRAIIAIHSTVFGPAGGGVRMYPYPDEADALTDALRLSKGMTYKAAMGDLPFGGGKCVILGDPGDKSEPLFEALGDEIEALGGRYFCGEDVGTSPADMAVINRRTNHVVGLPAKTGDPSPATAQGVFVSIQAALRHVLDRGDLEGVHVAIQGVGHVGYPLAEMLAAAGARLTVADTNPDCVDRARRELGAAIGHPDEIHEIEADVYSPCALGAVINDDSVDAIRAKIICGSANNQLADPRHGRKLHERDVVYVPDYVASVGGAVSAMRERVAYEDGEFERRIDRIGQRVTELLERSSRTGEPPSIAADAIAQSLVEAARGARSTRERRPAGHSAAVRK